MIGVVAQESDWEVVREFFELFKTPWEPYCEDGLYDVIIVAREDFSIDNARAEVILAYGSRSMQVDRDTQISCDRILSEPLLSFDKRQFPIYGGCVSIEGTGIDILPAADGTSHTAAGLVCEVRDSIMVRVGFDLFDEVRCLMTQGQPLQRAQFRTLDTHVTVMRDLIVLAGTEIIEIPPVPAGYDFLVSLTHDIDHPRIRLHRFDHTAIGFLYRAVIGSVGRLLGGRIRIADLGRNWLAALKLPLVYLGIVKDFWYGFDRYLAIEGDTASTFFVLPFKDEPGRLVSGTAPGIRASKYGVSDISDRIQGLVSAGSEVGLHGLDAWLDSRSGERERNEVQQVSGATDLGVRMHWLYFDANSPKALEAAGFSYDSTVGYNETIGFRAGTAQVYKLLGTKRLLELPLHVMDTALFYPTHMNLDERGALECVGDLLDGMTEFGGVLTLNWHDRSIAPERNWGNAYKRLLDDLRCRGGLCTSARRAVSWFQKRRDIWFDKDANGVRVACPESVSDSRIPGLRLRCHRPTRDGVEFVDSTLGESVTWHEKGRERSDWATIRERIATSQIAA